MRVNGSMIKPRVKVYTSIKMVLLTLANGLMISNMDMGMRNGQMELNIKEIMLKE
jgi:hypothetical protein